MTAQVEAPQVLSEDQQARAAALRVARDVLAVRSIAGSNVAGRTVGDLIVLADWVLCGPEPIWDDPDLEVGDDEPEP